MAEGRVTMTNDPGRWGLTLAGPGSIEVAATALEKALKTAGMTCRRRTPEEGRIEIVARQEASWSQIVLRCLPQRTCWLLSQHKDRLEVSGDFYAFFWFRWILFPLGLAVLTGVVLVWLGEGATFDFSTTGFNDLVLSTVVSFAVLAYLLLGGAHHREEIWQTLCLEVERARGSLEPKGSSLGRRRVGIYAVLLTLAFSLGAWAIKDFFDETSIQESLLLAAFLAALLVAVLFLLATAWLMARRHELVHRADAIVSGLATLLAALFYFSPAFLWMAAAHSPEVVSQWRSADPSLHGSGAWQILLASTSLPAVALAFFVLLGGLKTSYLARNLGRLQKEQRRGSYKKAAEGGRSLRRLRLVLGVTWTLLAILVFGALVSLVLCAVQAVDSSFPYPEADVVELSVAIGRLALAGWVNAKAVGGFIRLVWVVYGLAGVAFYTVSLAQLLWSRHIDRRMLRAAAESDVRGREPQVREAVARLAGLAKLDGVRLVVEPEPKPGGAAECFFNLRDPDRFVIVTQGALIDFDEPELDAVLAHELVHLREGHCRKRNLLRWLGRLTFVGDGFVLALQDSFGYEKEADRLLLEEGWATPEALAGCLKIMKNAAFGYQCSRIFGFAPAAAEEDRPAKPTPEDELRKDWSKLVTGEEIDLPFRRRWRLSWYVFRQQYFAADKLHYWHPTFNERLEAVRSWSGATPSV